MNEIEAGVYIIDDIERIRILQICEKKIFEMK